MSFRCRDRPGECCRLVSPASASGASRLEVTHYKIRTHYRRVTGLSSLSPPLASLSVQFTSI